MDEVRVFLETLEKHQLTQGRIPGIFHTVIGRRISKSDGTVLSTGITWRQLASILKAAKFDKQHVQELGAEPDELAPRDREKMWYLSIGLAKVDSVEAIHQADQLVELVKPLGYIIGPSPTSVSSSSTPRKKK